MKPGTFLIGLLLILAGLTAFLSNLGYPAGGILRLLFNYWPLLLILLGIVLFLGGRIPHRLAFIIVIVLCAGVAASALYTSGTIPRDTRRLVHDWT